MKLKNIYIVLLLAAVIYSCKKEEIGTVTAPVKASAPVLTKVLVDNQATDEYVYNDSNLVVQQKSISSLSVNHYNSEGLLTSTLYYGNDDILSSDAQVSQAAANNQSIVTSATGKIGGTITYVYNINGQLIKTTYSQQSNSIVESSDFTYDNNNRIMRQTTNWGGTATGYTDYMYDGVGNLATENLYNLSATGAAELITTTQYAYDKQPNPYKTVSKLTIPGINTNENNIVKQTYTIHLPADHGPDNVSITENTYAYNATGYPISQNGNVQYIYK